VVVQGNGKPSIERGQKMFMNSQNAQIATVCSLNHFCLSSVYATCSFRCMSSSVGTNIFTFFIFIKALHMVHVCLNISIIMYIFKLSRINHATYVIRPWEVGMPCLSWNWPAKQQGTPPTPRSQAAA